MTWLMLGASIIIWAGWIIAISYLSEPLAERLHPWVATWWDDPADDDWVASCYVAACIVALLAGLVGIGAWWLFAAVVL